MKNYLSLIWLFLFALIHFSATSQWSHTQLPTFTIRAGVATLGSKVYVAGGGRLSTVQARATVDIYDLNTQEWTQDKLSVARDIISGVSCGSKVIFAGGYDFDKMVAFSDVDVYDTTTKKWTTLQLLVPRFGIGAFSYENQVMFAGGLNGFDPATQKFYSLVEIYNFETQKWTTTSLSESKTAYGAAVSGSKVYIVGGITQSSVSDKIEIYDFKTGTWSMKILPVARGWVATVAIGNKLIIAGGITANNLPTDRVDIYDVETGEWTVSSLSTARATSAVTACDKAFFTGGGKLNINNLNWETATDVVDIYDPANGEWSLDKLRNPLVNHSVITNSNHILVIGGTNLTDTYSYVDIYTCLTTNSEIISSETEILKLYPNPASESVEINFTGVEKKVCVTISGISGQKVYKSEFQSVQKIKLDLTHLKSGIYFVKTETPDYCITKKLILAKK
jgi:N-acetylneuraminic acid mutarotase